MKKFLVFISIISGIFLISPVYAECSPDNPDDCEEQWSGPTVGQCNKKNDKVGTICTDRYPKKYQVSKAACADDGKGGLTCAAKCCKKPYYLVLKDGSRSQGICYTQQQAINMCNNCKGGDCEPVFEERTINDCRQLVFVKCTKKQPAPKSFKIEYDMTKCGYDANNTTPNCATGEAPTNYKKGEGATITCKLEYNKPHVFHEWCKDSALKDCAETQIIEKTATENKKFYAKCDTESESHSITYNNGNCGTLSRPGANCPEYYEEGKKTQINCIPETRSNYTFIGWCDDDTLRDNCNKTKTIEKTATTDVNFYAKCNTEHHATQQNTNCKLIFNNNTSIDNVSTGESAKRNAREKYTGMGGSEEVGSGEIISRYIGTNDVVIQHNISENLPRYNYDTPHLFDLTEVLVNGKHVDDLDDVIKTLHDPKTTYAEFECNNGNPSINLSEQKNPIGRAECTLTGYCNSDDNYGDYTGMYSAQATVNINAITQKLDAILDEHFTKSSVWKNDEGKFNTARLASDSIAGVVLGTVGGIVTSKIIKKNQIKNGFQDLKCTIGGQAVATYGDEFTVGLQ